MRAAQLNSKGKWVGGGTFISLCPAVLTPLHSSGNYYIWLSNSSTPLCRWQLEKWPTNIGNTKVTIRCVHLVSAKLALMLPSRELKWSTVDFDRRSNLSYYHHSIPANHSPTQDTTLVWKSHKNVSFNIASEASYVYIFHFGEFCGQTVLPDRSLFIGQKLAKCQNSRAQLG